MYAGPAGILFIEYKWITIPKRPTTKVKLGLSALQLEWLDRFYLYGQKVIVAAGFTDGVIVLTDGDWHLDLLARDIPNYTFSKASFLRLIVSLTQET